MAAPLLAGYHTEMNEFSYLVPLDRLGSREVVAQLSAGRGERAIHHARRALAANPNNAFYPEIEREIELAKQVLLHGP